MAPNANPGTGNRGQQRAAVALPCGDRRTGGFFDHTNPRRQGPGPATWAAPVLRPGALLAERAAVAWYAWRWRYEQVIVRRSVKSGIDAQFAEPGPRRPGEMGRVS